MKQALALIDDPTADVRVVQHCHLGPLHLAWTDPAGVVWLNDQTEEYKAAKHGHPVALAAVIAHELVHVHGGGEEPAYAEQLRVLRQLGAPHAEIVRIEQARDWVLSVIARQQAKE
jgi:hypothetical protein